MRRLHYYFILYYYFTCILYIYIAGLSLGFHLMGTCMFILTWLLMRRDVKVSTHFFLLQFCYFENYPLLLKIFQTVPRKQLQEK